MKIEALRQIIGNSDDADARALDALLTEIDAAEVSEFISAIRAAVSKVANALAKKRKAAEESETTITRLVAELHLTSPDNAAFKEVVDRMKRNKSIKLGEATEIANRFLGDQQTFKSKPEAAKAILKRQISDKRRSDRQAGISGIF